MERRYYLCRIERYGGGRRFDILRKVQAETLAYNGLERAHVERATTARILMGIEIPRRDYFGSVPSLEVLGAGLRGCASLQRIQEKLHAIDRIRRQYRLVSEVTKYLR